MADPYPAHRETDVVLRDGSTMHLRPARPDDRAAVEDYLLRLSPESRRLRFWAVSLDVGETARSAVEIDHDPVDLDAVSREVPEGRAEELRDAAALCRRVDVPHATPAQMQPRIAHQGVVALTGLLSRHRAETVGRPDRDRHLEHQLKTDPLDGSSIRRGTQRLSHDVAC